MNIKILNIILLVLIVINSAFIGATIGTHTVDWFTYIAVLFAVIFPGYALLKNVNK